jgi:hypothetical protein
MGEYWVGEGTINDSVKHASSVAHVYGHSVVGAEALTASPGQAGWRNQPRQWKPFADRGFTTGINRIIYHRFAHQPWVNVLPGMTMGPWGSHVDRTNTIWPYMTGWDRYLSRCQYMLQSGTFVGDVLLYPGEDAPQSYSGEGADLPEVPKGYDFDFCGRDPLMSVSVRNGRLVLPDGASYAVLALPNTTLMTAQVARKIRDLVHDGAIVVGPKPISSPSLREAGSGEILSIADEVWGPGSTAQGSRVYGKGRIVWGATLQAVLQRESVSPDFGVEAKGVSEIHRRLPGADFYFVASNQAYPRTVMCQFRQTNLVPELWNPQTGTMSDANVWRATPHGCEVQIPFEADGSTFVVFRRKPAGAQDHIVDVRAELGATDANPHPTLTVV